MSSFSTLFNVQDAAFRMSIIVYKDVSQYRFSSYFNQIKYLGIVRLEDFIDFPTRADLDEYLENNRYSIAFKVRSPKLIDLFLPVEGRVLKVSMDREPVQHEEKEAASVEPVVQERSYHELLDEAVGEGWWDMLSSKDGYEPNTTIAFPLFRQWLFEKLGEYALHPEHVPEVIDSINTCEDWTSLSKAIEPVNPDGVDSALILRFLGYCGMEVTDIIHHTVGCYRRYLQSPEDIRDGCSPCVRDRWTRDPLLIKFRKGDVCLNMWAVSCGGMYPKYTPGLKMFTVHDCFFEKKVIAINHEPVPDHAKV